VPDMSWQVGRASITVAMSMVKFFSLVFTFPLPKKKQNKTKQNKEIRNFLPQSSYGPAWVFTQSFRN